MRLSDLRGAVGDVVVDLAGAPGLDAQVTGVVHDTVDVAAGSLFCCVRGSRVDGHDLAEGALAAGAVALVVDHPLPEVAAPQLVVADVRRAMGPVAAAFWGHPSQALQVLGVTGTAGKTTVTHLLQSVLRAAGRPCGLIGTLSGARTTPDATELQAQLAAVRQAGDVAVALEVSSHGLELHRIDGTRFAVAIFTNLSRDHLDFHRSMDAYFAAKSRLFTPELTDRAVICIDDPWGRRLLDQLDQRGDVPTVPYGLADARDLQLGPHGARFVWHDQPVTSRLAGRFNVRNALAAATAAQAIGLDPPDIVAGLQAAEPVPGRFEPVDVGQPFGVLVDYAHKPDALEKALEACRELAEASKGRVIVVFGCGGDRDATKRPVMGEVAVRLADQAVLTSDNPRSEDPLAIIAEVRAGVPADGLDRLTVEPDRRQAIGLAVDAAEPGDVVLMAGKGHEQTQTIGDEVLPFDDREVAREVLAKWAGRPK